MFDSAAIFLALVMGGGVANGTGECCSADAMATPTTAPTTAPATQPAADAEPINKLCPIQKEEIDKKVTYIYDGKVIGFCCEDCIPKFKEDPAKYMKDLK